MFFLFFVPISGWRPEIPVLAGGQGRNQREIFNFQIFGQSVAA